MNQYYNKLLMSVLIIALAFPVLAATPITAVFQSTTVLSSTCLVSADNVSFGTFAPAVVGYTSITSPIRVTCSNGIPFNLSLSEGVNGTYASRKMIGSLGDKLSYQMYTNVDFVTVFGDGSSSTSFKSGIGNASLLTFGVVTQLPLNQYVKPDIYTDSITITLSY